MFKKLSKKFSGKSKKVPEYEGPIQKRIVLLNKIKDLAVSLVNDCTALSKTFDHDDAGPLKNMSECLAINLKLLANAVKAKDEAYATFLLTLAKAYDDLGFAQRKYQARIKENIIDPLGAWISTEYARMNNEILTLHDRKRDMDKSKKHLTANSKKEDQILAEQTSKEFERQMEVVRSELMKLTSIKNDHAGIFYDFLECYKIYHTTAVEIFEGIEANKWATLISGAAQTQ